jgi:hypothetical protein
MLSIFLPSGLRACVCARALVAAPWTDEIGTSEEDSRVLQKCVVLWIFLLRFSLAPPPFSVSHIILDNALFFLAIFHSEAEKKILQIDSTHQRYFIEKNVNRNISSYFSFKGSIVTHD